MIFLSFPQIILYTRIFCFLFSGCSIYGFFGGLSGTVSIMTLASISLDRYYVVVYPLQRAKATLRARICVVLVWLYGLAFASVPLMGTKAGRYVPEG